MKLHNLPLLLLGAVVTAASCSDIDNQVFEGGTQTAEQRKEVVDAVPSMSKATFTGMFTIMGQPRSIFPNSNRADDFGFPAVLLSLDLEGADMSGQDNGYNWFSAASELSTRDANYANPYLRYTLPYRHIGMANDVIAMFDPNTTVPEQVNMLAQARAMRAFDYLMLAPYFQFGYATSADQPCVPLLSSNPTNNPRATVAAVYEAIIEDLNYAIDHLAGYNRGADKFYIDQQVAYGLRARANLNMGKWTEAAADAAKAMEGYTPASISDVSEPAFCDMVEANWIWAVNLTDVMVEGGNGFRNPSSWFSAFTGNGYAPATDNVPMINVLLYNQIPSTDVRKGWWLNAERKSPNWANIEWAGAVGDQIADLEFNNENGKKNKYPPYTNIKFGQKKGIGSIVNSNDFPLMRVEEMVLIQAEALVRSGDEAGGKKVLEDFVKTYRDPQYTVPEKRSLLDEIWFQRRVELWGEGFFTNDAKRLGKPIVRFHENVKSNFPDAFRFNIDATDGWLNMRFPNTEKDQNKGIVDNQGGSLPVPGQNPGLRDGVTD